MAHYIILDKSERPTRSAHTIKAAAEIVASLGWPNVSKVVARDDPGGPTRSLTKDEASAYITESTRIFVGNMALLKKSGKGRVLDLPLKAEPRRRSPRRR